MGLSMIDIEIPVERIFDKVLPEPDILEYYNRISRREIMLNCEIDDTCVDYAKQIMEWNIKDRDIPIEDRTPIKIYINSGGGLLTAAWSLIDAMLLSKTPVITYGIGCIYSAASMIFIAGHKRYCLPHASYMIHDGSSVSADSISRMVDDIEFTKQGEEKVKQYFIERTSITPELYDTKYRMNWWMYPDEMIKYGIASAVITSLDNC